MATTHRARVRRGARLLDERLGRSWARRVRLRDLALESVNRCVLGQLYEPDHRSPFDVGLEALDITAVESADYGFAHPEAPDHVDLWGRLGDLWADEIRARRGSPRRADREAAV